MGSSLRKLRWRYSYRPLAQGWKGATLSISAMLASSPSRFMRTLCAEELSTKPGELALAQYPISPGPIPRRTCPSGHRGAGFDAARWVGGGASLGADNFFPP